MRVETDHKPLETIVQKPLQDTPKRLQRMLLSRAYLPTDESTRDGEDPEVVLFYQELEAINLVQEARLPC